MHLLSGDMDVSGVEVARDIEHGRGRRGRRSAAEESDERDGAIGE